MAMSFDRPELPDLIGFLQRGRLDMMDEPESVLPTAQVRCPMVCFKFVDVSSLFSCQERRGAKLELVQNITAN